MIAFLREPSLKLEHCELTHVRRTPVDVKAARKQHAKFASELKELGVEVESLAALPDQPDGVFVEDAAVVLPEVGIIACSNVTSRQPEIESVATTVARYRPVVRIVSPASIDGGDVLRIGRALFVGISGRTNNEGAAALAESVEAHGYEVRPVEVHGCLHLKTACTFVPPHFLIVNPEWVDAKAFGDLRVIAVDASEPFAANTLTVGRTTLVSAAFPKTEQRLREAGIKTRRVDVSEFHKAEAGLTCLALFIEPRTSRPPGPTVGMKMVEAPVAAGTDSVFSSAVVHDGVVYVSGQLPVVPKTGKVVTGGIEEQTEQAMDNLEEILGASGSGMAQVLRLTCYIADAKTADRVTEICARRFNGHRPAGSVLVAKTLRLGCAIALDATAAISEET